MIRTLVVITALLTCSAASAMTWQVDDVLHGTDSGFGFSVMHKASAGNPMSANGEPTTKITSASGSYVENGLLSLTLGFDNADILTLDGTLAFDGDGKLDDDYSLAFTYSGSGLYGLPASGFFGFKQGTSFCCGNSTMPPNSFLPDGGFNYLTLWGANIDSDAFDGSYASMQDIRAGIDIRLEMSPVPVPAAVYLFGSALLGLYGWQRRKAVC